MDCDLVKYELTYIYNSRTYKELQPTRMTFLSTSEPMLGIHKVTRKFRVFPNTLAVGLRVLVTPDARGTKCSVDRKDKFAKRLDI